MTSGYDPLVLVQRGDLNPPGMLLELSASDPRGCSAEDDGFLCTREAEHVGKHIACDAERVVHIWR